MCVYPVVSCLVFVIDPVKSIHSTILDAVFSNPLISVTAALGEDTRHHPHLPQINLDPLVLVIELGQPCTPDKNQTMSFCCVISQ